MNEQNACDSKVDAAMVEGPVEKVSSKEVREAIRKMKQGKVVEVSEIITCCRWQDCRGNDATALNTSFGWKGNPR